MRKTVIFDTSSINQLADDSTDSLNRGVGIAYKVRVTGTSLAEVSATRNPVRRERLIRVLRLLLLDGICIKPYQWIMSISAKEYLKDRRRFRWDRLKLRFPEAEQAVARHELLDDHTSEQTRAENKAWGQGFEEMHRKERIDFDQYFSQTGDKRPSFARHCAIDRKSVV